MFEYQIRQVKDVSVVSPGVVAQFRSEFDAKFLAAQLNAWYNAGGSAFIVEKING